LAKGETLMKHVMTLLLCLLLAAQVWAANALNFNVELSGDNEVEPVETDTTGTAILHVNQDLTEIDFKLDVRDGEDALGVAGSHLHCGAAGVNGPVVVFLAGAAPPGFDGDIQVRATLSDDSMINTACGETIADLVESILDGNVYVNVHSIAFPGGVIRGQVE
jgi:hypothetical protein